MNAMTEIPIREHANAAAKASAKAVALSILVPFYRDDATPLIKALAPLMRPCADVELVLYDDGEPDAELNRQICAIIDASDVPVRLLTSARNRGRAAGRNLLAEQAHGSWVLYLDADMTPPDAHFLSRYREVMAADTCDAVFGGYETDWPTDPDLSLHAVLSRASDQHDAATRNETGPTAFCSSNLLVRAAVMQACPYDDQFTGWGWEDVDWAVSAAGDFNLLHIDNPARHGGLQTADVLLEKFRAGAANYKRLLARHPELADLPGARAARLLKALPGQHRLRGLWSLASTHSALPLRVRALALKLWRASWASEVI
ncbi:glycosyltransferase family 2 protein [Maricaulis sp.]|uniref:glycosyltransferase family 2 protein n=1 Tax=Maricaulis sp. TaxID=1486257 RepID=UPI002B2713B2|nr:glycosyltransferase [Maricaulis sp.]